MKFVLAAVLCALSVKTVLVMPVAEPGVQSDQLSVVPLEKNAPVLATEHVLRRETPETAVPEISLHREGETPEEHAKHANLPTARLDDNAEKPETVKEQVAESASSVEKVKLAETADELPEKKEDALLKVAEVVEDAIAAKAVAAEIITPAETLAPIPADSIASVPVEKKAEAPVAEGKNAPAKEIDSELKDEIKSENQAPSVIEKIEEPQPIVKSSPIAIESEAPIAAEPVAPVTAVAAAESSPKQEKKIEPVVAESEQKAIEDPKEEVKKVEDKTDRVTRGTEEASPVDSSQVAPAAAAAAADAPLSSASVSAPIPVAEVAAAVAEPEEKLLSEVKEEKIELPEKKLEAIEPVEASKTETKPEMAKAAESSSIVEASEAVASVAAVEQPKVTPEKDESIGVKAAEPMIEAKSTSAKLEAESEVRPSEAAVAPTETKPEPVVDTINAKSEPIEASKESIGAVKSEDSSSSEEKSSEEDQSDEKLENAAEAKSVDIKKDESKAEELPKPQEVKEMKKSE